MDAKKPPTLKQLREQRERLLLAREVKLLERSSRLLENYFVGSGNYNDLVDPRERWKGPDGLYWIPIGSYDDRRYGADLYTVVDEQSLTHVRSRARMLLAVNPYAKGIISNLTNYIIGQTGFQFQAVSDNAELAGRVQSVIDQFIEEQEFGRRMRETFRRTRRDGEAFLRTFAIGEGRTAVRFIEPECVMAPQGREKDPEWSFGIHTDPEDVETVLGYWVRCGQSDPGEELDVEDVEHLAINTDETVKRGYSDLECIHDTLELARKLLRNLGEGSAIQAAIAYIRQHETASKDQVQAFVDDASDYSYINSRTGKTENFEYVGPGQIVDIPKGLTYQGPPLASANIAGHVEVLNALLRMAAASLNIPEFMVSSDASNANYASTLVSESPFVKLAMQEQQCYGDHFTRIIWRVVRNAVAAGLLPSETEDVVDITAEAPSVESRDKLAEAQRFQIEAASGVRSVQTWQAAIGLDPDEEQSLRDEWQERNGLGDSPLELPPDELGQAA